MKTLKMYYYQSILRLTYDPILHYYITDNTRTFTSQSTLDQNLFDIFYNIKKDQRLTLKQKTKIKNKVRKYVKLLSKINNL